MDELLSGEELKPDIEKGSVLAQPLENGIRTVLYTIAAAAFLIMSILGVYSLYSEALAAGDGRGTVFSWLGFFTVGGYVIKFLAVSYGLQLSVRNKLTAKIAGSIMCLPYVTAALLKAPFSFKFAAVHAGLGWIGKNDVVITAKYGPRVRLSAVLINERFVYGEKIIRNHCPEDCHKCVDACPHKALRDVPWNIDSFRSEIIDYRLCNEKRSLYLKTHGRKNACGLCMAACPFGT